MSDNRNSFTGKIGFVLAAAGSAVGLGNLWRFPYLAAKYGGGIFLLVYLILAVTFGFSLMIAEISLGRKTGLSCIGAYSKLNSKFGFIGYLSALIPIIITPYYCSIGGWVLKYLYMFVTGQGSITANSEYFGTFISSNVDPLVWFLIFLGLTILIVIIGVEKGIENVSKFMMPLLILIVVGISIYVLTLPGAMTGLKYYLAPDIKQFSGATILQAMTQLFFSLSLAMGIMITYGSYMKKDISIENSTWQIEIFDTGVAFFAGLAIIPAIFACASPEELKAGPSLMFIVLPKVFMTMPQPMGQIIGALFFILVFFAAITSSISLFETVVSIFNDKILKNNRSISIFCSSLICLILGGLSTIGYGLLGNVTIIGMQFLDFFDYLSNTVLMPIVSILTCIFVGYVIKPETIIEEVEISGIFKLKKLFYVMIKYIAPVLILLIFLTGVGFIK